MIQRAYKQKPSDRRNVLVVLGTRPEAIKMAPVITSLTKRTDVNLQIMSTGQHAEMLDEVLDVFSIKPNIRFTALEKGQSLSRLGSKLLSASEDAILASSADLVLVHGDTSSAMFGALAAFNLGVQVGHVEAGLRTGNIYEPFPEEWNRVAISKLANLHFCPTFLARDNLLREGVAAESAHIVGNTIVDAVRMVKNEYLDETSWSEAKTKDIRAQVFPRFGDFPYALITLHRRENAGTAFETYLKIIASAAKNNPTFSFVFPVHPNPAISSLAHQILGGAPNVNLVPPLDYLTFSMLIGGSAFVISDSGGLQEEAVTYSKQLLLCRTTTERPEAIEAGLVDMIGSNFDKFSFLVEKCVVESFTAFGGGDKGLNLDTNPFGDGHAADRISSIVLEA